MKTEAYKLYSRVFWIFLPNFIKIAACNFELYRFKVKTFFETQCTLHCAVRFPHQNALAVGESPPHWKKLSLGLPNPQRNPAARSLQALLHTYATKSPLVTMGCPTFTPKFPLPVRQSSPLSTCSSLDPADPIIYPKRHPDPTSRVSTIHQTDRQTDRQTKKNHTVVVNC